jgi:hypothetical protein
LGESKASPPSEREQGASICEPKRLEGDHHFWGSERNLGGELSGERFFDFNGLRGSKQGKVFLALLPWRSKRHNARGRGHAETQDCP